MRRVSLEGDATGNASMKVLPWMLALAMLFPGCGKEKPPRTTDVSIGGYPFPFGYDVGHLLGKANWDVTSDSCPAQYRGYKLQNPPKNSRWGAYSQVVLTADSLNTLQGFSATQSFSSDTEAHTRVLDLLEELRQRYGAQTDSIVKPGREVLARFWQDKEGNVVGVSASGTQVMVTCTSGRYKRECPG